MTHKTWQRKSYIANIISETIQKVTQNLSLKVQLEVVELSLLQFGLLDQIKSTKTGRELMPMKTTECVWKFWHSAENAS